jgi:preprotein translocase subunit SecG
MTLLFVILIFIAAFVLGLIVLIQNPKGGGLAGSFGGLSTQFMGVKQTTDVLEKGTWLFAGIIGVLCILSSFFMDVNGTGVATPDAGPSKGENAPAPSKTNTGNAAPFNPGGLNTTPPNQQQTPPDSK